MVLNFLRICFLLGSEILLQEFFIRRYLSPFIRSFKPENDGSLTFHDIKRMRYYARFAPSLLGTSYAMLAGRNMSHKERKLMTLLGAAVPIFDDYFDHENLSEERLQQIISHPESAIPLGTREKAFISLLQEIKNRVVQFEFFNKVYIQVFEAQIAAKQQESGNMTYEDLHQICFDKGGYSALLFRTIMANPAKTGENEAIYHFGGMVQWVDDMFDVYEDSIANIQTFATPGVDIRKAKQHFLDDLSEMIRLFKAVGFQENRLKLFLNYLIIFFSFNMVCFEQLEKLQGKNDALLPRQFMRKELICDMEKWENVLKWFRYCNIMRSAYIGNR
jgi:hypothetical protein